MRVVATVSAVVALTAGCAATLPAGSAGSPSADTATSAVAALPSRAEFGSDPTPDPIRGGPLAEDLAARVRQRLDQLDLEGDGRMADVATRMAVETQRRGKPVSAAELDAYTRDTGFVGPAPTVFVVPRVGGAWDKLDEFLSMSPQNVRFTRYGVAVLDMGGAVVGAVALGSAHLTLEPVKRRVAESDRVAIRGTLASGYTRGEVAWTRPDGSTERKSVGDSAIAFETPPLVRGVHRLEVLAVGPSGLEVLANMPVACGVEIPRAEAAAAPIDESNPKAAMLELVNRERARAGLRPLELDPTLDQVAASHSKDMVESHFFGHQSPTTGMVEDRLRAVGLRLGMFGENVAKGPSMAESHSMLLSSPAHRANILNARFSHVGIGVVAERESDPPLFAVTEVFAGFPAPLSDVGSAASAALSVLNGIRARVKASELVRAPVLDAAAGEIAGLVAASATANPIEVGEPVIRRRLAGTRYRRPLMLTGFSLDPRELAHDARLDAPRLRAAGVAVVQAPPGGAPKTNVVVFVLSE